MSGLVPAGRGSPLCVHTYGCLRELCVFVLINDTFCLKTVTTDPLNYWINDSKVPKTNYSINEKVCR